MLDLARIAWCPYKMIGNHLSQIVNLVKDTHHEPGHTARQN